MVPNITEEMLEGFAADLKGKLKDGPIALRKAYLQAMIERIVVDDQQIEITGKKDRLLRQLVKATPNAPKPRAKVLSFARHWRAKAVFTQMIEGLAAVGAEPRTIMIDATYLKAHRTASSLRVKKGALGG